MPIAEREKFMNEWARGGHGILRRSLGREPSQRNISTHLSATGLDRAPWGEKNVYEVETDVPIAKREKFMSEWARGGHGILRRSLGREPSQRTEYFHPLERDGARLRSVKEKCL